MCGDLETRHVAQHRCAVQGARKRYVDARPAERKRHVELEQSLERQVSGTPVVFRNSRAALSPMVWPRFS